jgi:hypothetical protein
MYDLVSRQCSAFLTCKVMCEHLCDIQQASVSDKSSPQDSSSCFCLPEATQQPAVAQTQSVHEWHFFACVTACLTVAAEKTQWNSLSELLLSSSSACCTALHSGQISKPSRQLLKHSAYDDDACAAGTQVAAAYNKKAVRDVTWSDMHICNCSCF